MWKIGISLWKIRRFRINQHFSAEQFNSTLKNQFLSRLLPFGEISPKNLHLNYKFIKFKNNI